MTLNCESLFKSQVAVTISKQYLDNAVVALLAFEVENMFWFLLCDVVTKQCVAA